LLLFIFFILSAFAQDAGNDKDTFFLSRKKGLIGQIAKSISISPIQQVPVNMANPYLIHTGKKIRNIEVLAFGFERNIYDTNLIKNSAGVRFANALHKNTTIKIIRNNLFFREADLIQPYLLADNERHLREQVFIQDARIIILTIPNNDFLVDVLVITKDVFSLGFNVNMSSLKKMQFEFREDNVAGSGSKIGWSTFYQSGRHPSFGHGAQLVKRNIKGSFIDWNIGFQTFKRSFTSGKNEEVYFFNRFEKPLVSAYIKWIGAADLGYFRTNDAYRMDSIYLKDFRYSYQNADVWFGYNFGSNLLRYKNIQSRVRKLIAVRGFYQHFDRVPISFQRNYDFRFANIKGFLTSFNVFKQNFYRTNFIYGFGRNEDVPEGFSAAIIAGWTNKQQRERTYYGIESQFSNFSKKGFYSAYTFRLGSYFSDRHAEDIDLLFNVDHFTRLKRMNTKWYNRNFFSFGFTRQFNSVLNPPLVLQSIFGLPYFNNGNIAADLRTTVKAETVFYHLRKFLGFRMAPFLFGDLCVIKGTNTMWSKSEIFSALGGGIRTRNENLTFGTIEFKGFYFPRTIPGMKNFRFEITSNLRFKYSNSFIRKPDFVLPN
ncbi:MAG: hypothetical protein ACOYKE_08755, partial [Ferruginibacter sp.]